jgi:hypothetical protein
MKRFDRTCACCGSVFGAGHLSARFCSATCKARAYYRRRRGAPEADAGLVVQPTIIDECDLPVSWLAPAGTEERVWQGTAIQRREADGFVNATAMCKANGRTWAKYRESERCQSYLDALSKMSGIRTFDLIESRRGRSGGTWIHPSLAIDLARWISPAFAVWMDGWFLESVSRPIQPARQSGITIAAKSPEDARWIWMDALWRHLVQNGTAELANVYQYVPVR